MMRHVVRGFAICTLLVVITTPAFAQDDAVTSARPAPLIRDAREALLDGAWDDAIEAYERLREFDPTRAAFPFNEAIAHYRKGDYGRAADLFKEASQLSPDPGVRGDAMYNAGNAHYANALDTMTGAPTGEEGETPPDPMGELTEALRQYRRVLAEQPDREDARANAELATRVLQQLKEQAQQQEPSESGDQEQESDDPQETPQSSDAEQGEGDEQEQSGDQQQQQQQGEQSEDGDQQQQGQPDGGDQPEDEQEAGAPDEPQDGEQEDGSDGEQGQDGEPQDGMSREEAERLLQRVRDNDRERRQARAEREQARHRPAAKDW